MTLCAFCASTLWGGEELCPHHPSIFGDDWAEGNRRLCDFFHRGKVPPRLSPAERDDEAVWAGSCE